MSKIDRIFNASRFWRYVFWVLLIVGIAMHLTTLTYSPVPWIDEVQVIEIGQGGIGEKSSGWNMCLTGNPKFDRQSWAPYYLGGWAVDAAYRVMGHWGPRSVTLLGLVLSSLLLYAYVRRRTKSEFYATVIGILWFAFPWIVQSARGGRVDVWVFVMLLIGLHALYDLRSLRGCATYGRYALAGAMAVCGCFVWATAALLAPIYVWAFFENFENPVRNWKCWIKPVSAVVVGSAVALALLLIPFYGHLTVTHELASWVSAANTAKSNPEAVRAALGSFVAALLAFPFVFFCGLCSLFLTKRGLWLKLGAVMFAVLCVFVAVRVYVYRVLYLVPYAFLGFVLLAIYLKESSRRRLVFSVLLISLTLVSYARSVVLRNGIEFCAREARSHQVLKEILENELGRDIEVYCDVFEVYYAGRDLGWKMYRDSFGKIDTFLKSNVKMPDTVIVKGVDEDCVIERIIQLGYVKQKEVVIPCVPPDSIKGSILRLAGKCSAIGPYLVYKKVNSAVKQ